MYSFKYIKEVLARSLPVLLLYFVSFSSFESMKNFPNVNLFSFNLHMIIIYFYILKYPDYLGTGHIFLAGLIKDVVVGIPLGTSSLSFLVLCFFSSYVRNVTLRSRMTAEWFTFIPALFFSFPIFYYLFKFHQRRFKED